MNERTIKIPCSISRDGDFIEIVDYQTNAMEFILYDAEEKHGQSIVVSGDGFGNLFDFINDNVCQKQHINNVVLDKIKEVEIELAKITNAKLSEKEKMIKDLTNKVQILHKGLTDKNKELEIVRTKYKQEINQLLANQQIQQSESALILSTPIDVELNPKLTTSYMLDVEKIDTGVRFVFRPKFNKVKNIDAPCAVLTKDQIRYILRYLGYFLK